MFFLNLWRAMVRATAALLLMAALATPALAEIGCAGESVVHLQGAAASDHGDEISGGPSQDQDEEGAPRGHCAFAHSHCAGIPSLGDSDPAAFSRVTAAYGFLPSVPLAPTVIETPQRPPDA